MSKIAPCKEYPYPPEADCTTSVAANIAIMKEMAKFARQRRIDGIRVQIKAELAEMGMNVTANERFIDEQIDHMAEAFA